MEVALDEPVRVTILETNSRLRQPWLDGFATLENVQIVGWAERFEEMVAMLNALASPQVVLFDLAAATVAQIHELAKVTKVIVLHEAGQEEAVLEALRAGAMGHLEKNTVPAAQILAAIRIVERGQAVLSPLLAGRLVEKIVQNHGKELKRDQ